MFRADLQMNMIRANLQINMFRADLMGKLVEIRRRKVDLFEMEHSGSETKNKFPVMQHRALHSREPGSCGPHSLALGSSVCSLLIG